MGVVLAIIQLVLVPILTVLALSIRFAGSARPLNVVDYARVDDPAGLHRWAGHRLLLLPAAFLLAGIGSLQAPRLALLFLAGAAAVALGVAVWLALGAERFQRAA